MQTLYPHILVPLDFTEQNDRALAIAKQICRPGQSRVTLLHVIETIDYVANEEVEQFYKMLTERARKKLDDLAARFRIDGIEAEGKIVLGKRARGTVTYVLQNEVDLVVLSSHRVDLSEVPKGLGTLSHQVSILCPCDVLLVK
jgi:nucleotide-binding universal stress UspA family protein